MLVSAWTAGFSLPYFVIPSIAKLTESNRQTTTVIPAQVVSCIQPYGNHYDESSSQLTGCHILHKVLSSIFCSQGHSSVLSLLANLLDLNFTKQVCLQNAVKTGWEILQSVSSISGRAMYTVF